MRNRSQHDPSNISATAFCGVAMVSLVPILAHQLGLLRRLPDPPGSVWNSDAITESKAAHPLGIPDAVLGLGSYGATLGLLIASRSYEPALRLLPWKLAADSAAAGFNTVRQVVQFRSLCAWCMGTALATVGMVYFGARSLRNARLTGTN